MRTVLSGAWWISPVEEWIQVVQSHVVEVIRNPERFGVTHEHIDHLYFHYGESKGGEGKARAILLTEILAAGWIRLRLRIREHTWTVQADLQVPGMLERIRAIPEKRSFLGTPHAQLLYLDAAGNRVALDVT